MSNIAPMVETLAKEWVKLFHLKPVLTSVTTIMISAMLIGAITYLDRVDRIKREAKRLENMDYQNQIEQLSQMENHIRQLLTFVNSQKKSLKETEDTKSSLKSEKEKLKPIVESDRDVVEALFRTQEERINSRIWRNRWMGFGFGILASLIASFIWFVVSLLLKSKHNKQVLGTA